MLRNLSTNVPYLFYLYVFYVDMLNITCRRNECYPQQSVVGLWTLNAEEGQNIQLHFLDFDTEATFDMVEVRDGIWPNSNLLGETVFCW